jgi:hypothetical protein
MEAAVGDRLHVHGNVVGHPERTGKIVEVRGAGGQPPCLARCDDGHTGLVFPGPDAIIGHPRRKGKKARDTGSRPSAAACFTPWPGYAPQASLASRPRGAASTRPCVAFVVWAPHGWCVSHLAVLVSPGLLAWLCGRRLPRDC